MCTFAIDDLNGDYVRVTGNATIDVFGIVKVTGSFGVEKKTNQNLYISGSTAENVLVANANLFTIGLANVSAFVGFGSIGLQLNNVDLAIALWSENVEANAAQLDERDGQCGQRDVCRH